MIKKGGAVEVLLIYEGEIMKFYTLEEIAGQLHMSTGTARNRIARGDAMPPFVKVGRRLLFSEFEFVGWLKTLSSNQKEKPLVRNKN